MGKHIHCSFMNYIFQFLDHIENGALLDTEVYVNFKNWIEFIIYG